MHLIAASTRLNSAWLPPLQHTKNRAQIKQHPLLHYPEGVEEVLAFDFQPDILIQY